MLRRRAGKWPLEASRAVVRERRKVGPRSFKRGRKPGSELWRAFAKKSGLRMVVNPVKSQSAGQV